MAIVFSCISSSAAVPIKSSPNEVCEFGGDRACAIECNAEGYNHGGWCDDHEVCHCKSNSIPNNSSNEICDQMYGEHECFIECQADGYKNGGWCDPFNVCHCNISVGGDVCDHYDGNDSTVICPNGYPCCAWETIGTTTYNQCCGAFEGVCCYGDPSSSCEEGCCWAGTVCTYNCMSCAGTDNSQNITFPRPGHLGDMLTEKDCNMCLEHAASPSNTYSATEIHKECKGDMKCVIPRLGRLEDQTKNPKDVCVFLGACTP